MGTSQSVSKPGFEWEMTREADKTTKNTFVDNWMSKRETFRLLVPLNLLCNVRLRIGSRRCGTRAVVSDITVIAIVVVT